MAIPLPAHIKPVKVESTNAWIVMQLSLDSDAIISARADAISVGVLGDAATACTCS